MYWNGYYSEAGSSQKISFSPVSRALILFWLYSNNFFIVFYYFSDIKRHLEQVHEGRKKFKCENCGKEYTEKKGLLVHIKRIHDNIRDEQCNQCGKLFFTKEVLKGHIRNIHNKDQNPRLKCEYCQKSYAQKGYFKIHQSTIHGA